MSLSDYTGGEGLHGTLDFEAVPDHNWGWRNQTDKTCAVCGAGVTKQSRLYCTSCSSSATAKRARKWARWVCSLIDAGELEIVLSDME